MHLLNNIKDRAFRILVENIYTYTTKYNDPMYDF